MIRYLKEGFRTTASQTFLLLVLWLYHFVWGFLLLSVIKSIVVPLMHRFPGTHLTPDASQLFLAESQFRLMKTDISHHTIALLIAFAAARMLLTPLLNAGVYYSLHHARLNSGYRFLQGIRHLGKPFFVYYAVQLLLTFAPLYWLYPIAKNAFAHESDYTSLGLALLPWAAAYIAYGFLIRLCFIYIQLGKTQGERLSQSLGLFLRKLPVVAAVALVLLAMSGTATAAALSTSLVWAGLSALVLQQLFHIVTLLFKLWTIAAQYHVYAADTASDR
ncbi:hypothetical protein ACFFNY_22480 [Paenibacillus hodogayensis]|uniref:DUF975 family protein n=1 Tax=Paenibacillus hodogayensis TaxID=279208 RepID=A0ABV5W197_9BACL